MELEFKPDFDAVGQRWEEFWAAENQRPLVSSVIPRAGATPAERPRYASGADGNFEPAINQLLGWAETHEFLGEAIPCYYLEFGADHFATLLGADLVFEEDQPGGWAVPFVEDLEGAQIRFRRTGKWWQRTVEFAEALREKCDGKLLIASNTLVANLDALAAIRGAQKLLIDVVERPDAVHRALGQITRAHEEIVAALGELLDYASYGSITRHGMYSRGRINVPQCDFSCMISPEMFRDFALPYLREEMRHLDAVEYHLDGPGATKHLEALCEIDKLGVIQWQPGAGNAQGQDWSWLYRRIDRLGKGQIRGGSAEELRRLCQENQNRKLFFYLRAGTRAEVEDCIAQLETCAVQ